MSPFLLKIIQEDLFSKELHDIRNGKELSTSSKIFRFLPFIDQQGLMRVGNQTHSDENGGLRGEGGGGLGEGRRFTQT